MRYPLCLLGILCLLTTLPQATVAANAPTTWGQIKATNLSQKVLTAPQFSGSYILDTITTPQGNTRYVVAEQYTVPWWKFWEESRIEVWARIHPKSCSYEDEHLLTVKGTSSIDMVKRAFCEVKDAYDVGKIALDCSATVTCAVLIPTGCGGGVGAGACVVACAYAGAGGAKDCVEGIIQTALDAPSVILPPSSITDFGEWLIDQVCQ